MKILFLPENLPAFHAKTLEERPMGGVTTGIIRLAEALDALGHEVAVLSLYKTPPVSKPLYLPMNQYEKFGMADVLITIRGWRPIFYQIPYKMCFFWTGDTASNLNTIGIGDRRVVDKLDALLVKSVWQAEGICEASGFPIEKTHLLSNGVYLPYFEGTEKRHRKRLIYSSTPVRGLQYLPRIFRHLKTKHPELELIVFSSFDRYSGKWPPADDHEDREFERIFKEVAALPDCQIHKSILQKDLAREFMKASVLAYPTNFHETSCITAMEAFAGGCPIVTSKKAALKETVGDAGILLEGDAGSEAYFKDFTASIDRLLTDDVHWSQMSEKGLKRAKDFDWNVRAKELISYINSLR